MMKTAILLVVLQLAIGAKLPDKFKRCHAEDPDSKRCFEVAIADAVRKIGTTGIPSLKVKPLQPMVVKKVEIDEGSKGPVAVKLQLANLKIYGIPESSIENFVRLSTYDIKATSLTPEIKIEADYVLDGQVLLLPIRGRGTCTITMGSVTAHHHLKGKPVTRAAEIYVDLTTFEVKLSMKRMSLNFRNLFNGDKTLGETMNNVLNENWELIFNELKPALEKAMGDVFMEYAKGIFDQVPYKDIFL